MNPGLMILTVLAAWSALSIVTSLLVGGMAAARDPHRSGANIRMFRDLVEPRDQKIAS